jgi:hypothetical protein
MAGLRKWGLKKKRSKQSDDPAFGFHADGNPHTALWAGSA